MFYSKNLLCYYQMDHQTDPEGINVITTEAEVEPNQEQVETEANQLLEHVENQNSQLKSLVEQNQRRFEAEISQKLENLAKKLDSLASGEQRPQSILKRTDDAQTPYVTPPKSPTEKSFPTSPFRSRSSSRNISPEREKGLLPVLQNVIYSNKVLLKENKSKFPEALAGIKKHYYGPETIADRMKNDASVIANRIESKNDLKMQQKLASLVPHSMGVKRSDKGVEHFKFNALPDELVDLNLGETALKNILKTHQRITQAGEPVRHVIEALINRYNHRLTESQFQDILVSLCSGQFKDVIRNAFIGKSLNRAIASILKLYGNVKSKSQKISYFQDLKVDVKKLRSSLVKILEAAIEAYPSLGEYEIAEKAIERALCSLPAKIRDIVNEVCEELREENEDNPFIEKLDYYQFIEMVENHMSDLDQKSNVSAKTVKSITQSTELTKQTLEGLQTSQTQIVAALTTLNNKIETLGNSKPNNSYRKSARQGDFVQMFYKIGDPGYEEAAEELSKKGNIFQVINELNRFNHVNRNKNPELKLKTIHDPNHVVNYNFDENGRYIPDAPPIDYNVILKMGNRYVFTDRFLQRVSQRCLACASNQCGAGCNSCIYRDIDQVMFTICSYCRQGFHARCLANAPAPPIKN